MDSGAEANVEPVNEFACLGIADCQQVLERLKGGFLIGELSYAAKTLMDKYKYDEDTLRRGLRERLDALERPRKKAVDLHISKKYALALEAYDDYFATLGDQVSDYETEQQHNECRQYVAMAKKRKWQMIVSILVFLIICGVIVDQVIYRKNIKAFKAALQNRDYENATETAIKISWRYDTEAGIANLISFLDERGKFNQLSSEELIRSSLDNYGGIKWQEVQSLVSQAEINEDLPQGIQQLRQAAEMTKELVKECKVLGENERDFNAIYEACNQKDADHYAHEKWERLQQLRDTTITQTNLQVIAERYELMLEITNQVARLMAAEKDMQPVKDEFEKLLKEEQIQVEGMHNYVSYELGEAQKRADIAAAKEKQFEFTDARLIYTRAIEHVKESQKNRQENGDELSKIEQARRAFIDLYKTLEEDVGLAQEKFPEEWAALSEQKKKAEEEYAKKERWKGDAYVSYEAALEKLKKLKNLMAGKDKVLVAKEAFERQYGTLDIGLAEKWASDQWNALRDQKKKADEAYETGDQWDDINACYKVASQRLEDLLVAISNQAEKEYNSLYESIDGEVIETLKKKSEWPELQDLVEKAKAEYRKPRYWEGYAYKLYQEAWRTLDRINRRAAEEKDVIVFSMDTYNELKRNRSEGSSGTETNQVPAL